MKRFLLAICVIALSVLSYGQGINQRAFTFAWLSDVHLNSFAYAEDDLRQSIEDINASLFSAAMSPNSVIPKNSIYCKTF